MHRLLLAGLLLSGATGAFAQPASGLLVVSAEALPDQPELVQICPSPLSTYTTAERTRSQAWSSSFVGTLVPIGAGAALIATNASDGIVTVGSLLLFTGVWAGPSAGHFYLGDNRRAWIGLGVRTAAIGVGALVGSLTSSGDLSDIVPVEQFLVTTAGVVVGAAYSFATINRSARERGIVVVPGVRPDGAPTLTLTARF